MKKYLSKQIRKAYGRKPIDFGFKLPFYLRIGQYRLCVYAMNMDWDSLRIKIEKDCKIVKVLKKGIY